MTTIEIAWGTLRDAAVKAGEGGVILERYDTDRSSIARYEVSNLHYDAFETLTRVSLIRLHDNGVRGGVFDSSIEDSMSNEHERTRWALETPAEGVAREPISSVGGTFSEFMAKLPDNGVRQVVRREPYGGNYVRVAYRGADERYVLADINDGSLIYVYGPNTDLRFDQVLEDGAAKMVAPELVSVLTRVHTLSRDLEDTRATTTRMRSEWAQFNAMLNEFAESGHYGKMCDTYEKQLEEWNAELSVFQFEGRSKDYNVTVDVVVRYRGTVPVTAANEDAAREQVDEMDSDEVLNHLGFSRVSDGDDIEFETDDVEEA